ncbi:MAG TPA: AbrB/MazE/SpoVT family DNA-binding domain-containing protein [Thermoanaerobaculia bacterium]|nr:AbrB/MazE/SpoVT family DNA-binding domain-containing protein [Thermoanaerobaculia bacterium]
MQSKIQRCGNSLAVRISKPFANDVGLREDSLVEISVVDGGLVIRPRPRVLFPWESFSPA